MVIRYEGNVLRDVLSAPLKGSATAEIVLYRYSLQVNLTTCCPGFGHGKEVGLSGDGIAPVTVARFAWDHLTAC